MVADNVVTGNVTYGVGFWGNPANVPDDTPALGHHLLGGNVYDKNKDDEIRFGEYHPAIRQLQDRWPSGDAGGINLPVKPTKGDPDNAVDGVLYVNTFDHKLRVYANGDWRTLTSW